MGFSLIDIKPIAVYKSDDVVNFLVEAGFNQIDVLEAVLGEEQNPGYVYYLRKNAFDDYEGIIKELAEENKAMQPILAHLFETLAPDQTELAILLSEPTPKKDLVVING
jgi:hypothetical protein